MEFLYVAVMVSLAVIAIMLYRHQEEFLRLFQKVINTKPKKGSLQYELDRLGKNGAGFIATAFLLSSAGFVLGLFLNNLAAAIMLAVFASLYWREKLKISYRKYLEVIDKQAETALLTTASLYDTNKDLIKSMEEAANCSPSPMREELMQTVLEYQVGKPYREALTGLVERTDNYDFDVLVKGISLSEEYGTDTSEVIRDISDNVRDRLILRDQIRNEIQGQSLMNYVFLFILPLITGLLFIFSSMARDTITTTSAGKILVCFMILVQFGAWYFTKKQGVVENL